MPTPAFPWDDASDRVLALAAQLHDDDPHAPYIREVAQSVREHRAAELAGRWAPHNPRPLCRDFTPQPAPAAYWCAHCHWNKPMHADETYRAAIAAAMGDPRKASDD